MDIRALKQQLRKFAAERDWEQFHSPKNLTMALAGEVGELTEIFQWLSEEQSRSLGKDPAKLAKVSEELADIAIYLIRLCDKLDVDLDSAVKRKLRENASKYPVRLSKGNAIKYNELAK